MAIFFRALYLAMPAASSTNSLRSAGLRFNKASIRPCSMIEYALIPAPVSMKSSIISRRRQGIRFMENSLSPDRKSRRLTDISLKSEYFAGPRPSSLEKIRDTSAMPSGLWALAPLKMMSSIAFPRSCFGLCSPMTQRIASTTLLFPHPLGPTTAVIPSGKSKVALL